MHRRSVVVAILFLLCAAVAVPAQSMDQRLDAVKEFKRFFRRFKETAQKVEAVETLRANECVPAALELVPLLQHPELEVRKAAMDVLGSYHDPATFAGLLKELPDMKKDDERAPLIEVFGRAGVRDAVPVLIDIAANDRRAGPQVRYEIARALGRIGDPAAEPTLKAMLSDSDDLVRLGAVDATRQLALKDLSPDVIALLKDPVWQVRSGALKALAVLRPQDAVQPIIDLMREGGRLAEEAADTLFAITTLDFGPDPDAWQKQWDRLLSIHWRIPTDAELAKARESRKRTDAWYGKNPPTAFTGISTTSRRILFIIDVSGSMEELVVERERFGDRFPDFQKLTIVKSELEHTIDSLDKDTFFNIVAFATDLDPWKKQLVPANVVNKASATSWVKHLEPIGGSDAQELASAGLGMSANLQAGKTNTYAALMYPFGIDPQKPVPTTGEPLKNQLDTVFFLSDGRPSTGRLVDTNEILEEVDRENDRFRIVFHAIAIGDFQKDFLRRLAQDNGGQFVDLGR